MTDLIKDTLLLKEEEKKKALLPGFELGTSFTRPSLQPLCHQH